MDEIVALWTCVVVFKVLDNAGLAEGVEALGDRGGVYQVPVADVAGDHGVEVGQAAALVQGVGRRHLGDERDQLVETLGSWNFWNHQDQWKTW